MFAECPVTPHLLRPEPALALVPVAVAPSLHLTESTEYRNAPLIVTWAMAAPGTANALATASARILRCIQKTPFLVLPLRGARYGSPTPVFPEEARGKYAFGGSRGRRKTGVSPAN